jgi:hypothetical protein
MANDGGGENRNDTRTSRTNPEDPNGGQPLVARRQLLTGGGEVSTKHQVILTVGTEV